MADAQYVIDIAANMPEGAATIAQLEQLTASLQGAGRRGESFQQAMAQVSRSLDGAKAAADAANAALAQGTDHYRVLEREALRASKAVEKAQAKGQFDPRAARAAHEASSALAEYEQHLRVLEGTAHKAGEEQRRLARHLDNVRKVAAHVDERNAASLQRYERLGQVVGMLPGPLQRLGGTALAAGRAQTGLTATFGATQASMILTGVAAAGVAVAIAAVTAAVVAGSVAWSTYIVRQADAERSADLTREAFAALSAETAAGASAFGTLTEQTGLSSTALASITKQLRAAKVSAADMPEALEAAALAEAALGAGGASDFITRLGEANGAVGELAAETRTKFGGIVAKQMQGLTAQSARLGRLWDKLFDGINIDPVLRAVDTVVSMLDGTHPVAQSFRVLIEGTFGTVASLAESAAYAIEAFALGFAINMMRLYLFARPAIRWLGELFGLSSDGSSLVGVFDLLGKAAVVGAVLFGSVFAVAIAAVGAALTAIFGPLVIVSALIYGIVTAVSAAVSALVEWVPKLYEVGANLIAGLAAGITAGITGVTQAITGAVSGAIDTAKDLLGIASPSKVFAEIGGYTAEGFAVGVDEGAAEAQTSLTQLVGADAAGSAAVATAPAPAAAGAGRASINLAGATFNFSNVQNAEQARDMFAEMLTRVLEGDADSLTGAVPAGA